MAPSLSMSEQRMVLVWQSPGGPPTTFHQMLFRARMSKLWSGRFLLTNYYYIKVLFAFWSVR
ncbi:hypothetical protein GBAR_LOCUS19952 [Geodia barretti]|uniref:Uncharacterized protein n=1 Tax=Geodia barretti TaxID=519541 RepID=A0AA35ST01_GEOBA|nr:hypothetical protein GBAR_LOCUS19952 [Geodia barretti]